MNQLNDKERLLSLFRNGNYKGVLKIIHSLDSKTLKDPVVITVHGHTLYEIGDYETAVKAYTGLIRLAENSECRRRAFYNRGLSYRELGKDESALADFFAAGVGYEKSRSFIGELLYLNSRRRPDRLNAAKKHLSIWLCRHPDDHYSRYWLGACYNQLDKPKLALKHMLKCLDAGYFTKNTVEGVVNELIQMMAPEEIKDLLEAKARQAGSAGPATTKLIDDVVESQAKGYDPSRAKGVMVRLP